MHTEPSPYLRAAMDGLVNCEALRPRPATRSGGGWSRLLRLRIGDCGLGIGRWCNGWWLAFARRRLLKGNYFGRAVLMEATTIDRTSLASVSRSVTRALSIMPASVRSSSQ